MIANMMLGRGKGGLEQAALDYAEMLGSKKGLSICRQGSWFEEALRGKNLPYFSVPDLTWQFWLWPWFVWKLQSQNINALICHSNKATKVGLRFQRLGFKIIGVVHNYEFRYGQNVDFLFLITKTLQDKHLAAGTPVGKTAVVPNITRSPVNFKKAPENTPLKIGTMGRFVDWKGFEDLILALALLKQRGISFQCEIGGDGPEREHLETLVRIHDLTEQVTFLGWVKDKTVFLQNVDIFCFPSRHEPFGILLLEGFAHHLPVACTRAEGPSEIATDQEVLFCKTQNPEDMAEKLEILLQDSAQRTRLSEAGHRLFTEKYTLSEVSKTLNKAVTQAIQ